MKKIAAIVLLFISALCQINSQVKLLTVAEKSEFKSTSNYNDVMTFIDQLKKSSKFIRIETIAKSKTTCPFDDNESARLLYLTAFYQ